MRILLADDHEIVREGIRRSFDVVGEEVVGEAPNGERAVVLARQLRPDVVLMDLAMPVMDGINATRHIRHAAPGVKVVVLTMHDDVDKTKAALDAGASAFLSKGSKFAVVLDTVRAVHRGETGLSPEIAETMLAHREAIVDKDPGLSKRQIEILQGVADGRSTKQVARDLGITQKTVHNHLNAVYKRLDSQSLTHAVLRAVRLGIVDLDTVAA